MSTSYFDNLINVCTPLHQISSASRENAVAAYFTPSGYLTTHTLEAKIKLAGRLRISVFLMAGVARLYPPLIYAIGVTAKSVAQIYCSKLVQHVRRVQVRA